VSIGITIRSVQKQLYGGYKQVVRRLQTSCSGTTNKL